MMNASPLKVLVVDDTVVYRKIVSDAISELPDVEVVGTAHNGKAAMIKIASLKPDLLTLDIEMPEMSGIEVLDKLQKNAPQVGAIMLSTLTSEGGNMTMKALELGAFDFIPKPQSGTMAENKIKIAALLGPMLKAFARNRRTTGILRNSPSAFRSTVNKNRAMGKSTGRTRSPVTARAAQSEIIAIGISTGGPNALAKMLPRIPREISAPIVIVQHMPPVFTKSLATSLNSKCAIEVREAVNGEPIKPGLALIAPGGKQMKIVAGADGKNRVVKITNDPPENSCKPSADYLFRSVAHHYVGRSTGVIMTGMGSDGTKGLQMMKTNGATVIAQNEATCVVFGMPKEPIESGVADVVSPLDKIADEIVKTVKKHR